MNPTVAVLGIELETGGLHYSNIGLLYSSLINIMELKAIAVYVNSEEVINIMKVYKED